MIAPQKQTISMAAASEENRDVSASAAGALLLLRTNALVPQQRLH
eukprot:CAMPEP_0170622018 /NCGR_PEP_ID=MMETSP0224-20130122/28905_1 /TAXON_ID=285029 /ORGANISM="Togula jolla, Strain CCCM 725" /LENGTH=44 /DNA_ID= /DNA_START= /DNA_END= /DNA_ORIENTATION=